MLILNRFPPRWLFLCLNLIGFGAAAQQQEPISVEVIIGTPKHLPKENVKELPLFQLGLEVGRPVTFSLGMIRDWKQVLPLEVVGQYRLGDLDFYGQLYGGYFQGSLNFENGSELRQRGAYLKPGLLWAVVGNRLRHKLTMEANLLFSWGTVRGKNLFYGPIFGDYEATATFPYHSFGAEFGVGTDLIRIGSYKLKALGRVFMSSMEEHEVDYLPGIGYAGFLGFGMGANFYLMRAW